MNRCPRTRSSCTILSPCGLDVSSADKIAAMWRPRRRFLTALGAAATLAAAVLLVWSGLALTRRLERQAAIVFEDSAVQEARARLPEIERGLKTKGDAAVAALLALPPDPSAAALTSIEAAHPIIETPFILAADQTLAFPPPPPAVLASLAAEEPAPPEFLRAVRLALKPAPAGAGDPVAALATVATAPEIALPWRLRARAAQAGFLLRTGRAVEASETYRRIEDDFADELRESSRPSRAQIAAARARALSAQGRDAEARTTLWRAIESIEMVSPARREAPPGSDDAALLLDEAARHAASASDPPFAARLAASRTAHEAAARSIRFARTVREWILPRLARGSGEERIAGDLSGESFLIAWKPAPAGSWQAAAGFCLRPRVAVEEASAALAAGSKLPLALASLPLPAGFHELLPFPGSLGSLRIGLDRAAWNRHLGSARRPFRIAAVMIVCLGLLLVAGAAFGVVMLRREMFLARMKTEFVANVSHELKTPLALIRLFGETLLLNRVRDSDKAREYYGIIVRESERLTHLVNNVLDFSSIEAGKKAFDFASVNLGRTVSDTLATYQFQLEEKGFRIEPSIAPDLPSIHGDANAIAQALINLLNNAVKYSTERKEIAVRAERLGPTVRVSVADRGIGISPDEIRLVFDAFYRSNEARRIGTRGSGLGLSLVQHILKAHGGSVELKSKLGEGSIFTLVFPIPAAADRPSTETSAP